ncbi:hypothetical protein OAO87_02660 [bacterium]|nr:hypothetical protein [bacterium]
MTTEGTTVAQAEPIGRARDADACGRVQHDGLARPRKKKKKKKTTTTTTTTTKKKKKKNIFLLGHGPPPRPAYMYRLPWARPNALQPSRPNY